MEKNEILNMLYEAITEISPYTSELLSTSFGSTNFGIRSQDNVCLVDLGINSIDYAQICHILMNRLKVSCSLEVFTSTNNINDIVDIFYEMLPMSE